MNEIKVLKKSEYPQALNLAWEVFKQYEAPDYPKEGIEAFHNSINDPSYIDQLRIYGSYDNNKLVGILATRSNGKHVALFFVNGTYHKQGIGRHLFEAAIKDNTTGQMTVNSSPYAVEVYHHLGFTDTNTEQQTDGIRYTPMLYTNPKIRI